MFNLIFAGFSAYCATTILLSPTVDLFTYIIFFALIFVFCLKILDLEKQIDILNKHKISKKNITIKK
jgi:hypothetical protein